MTTRDHQVNIFKQGRQQFTDAFGVSESQRRAIVRYKNIFFNGFSSTRNKIKIMVIVMRISSSKSQRKP